jgi:putative PIN family toxin of toxin-antitoxin system
VRAVLDPNVLISAILSKDGSPAQVLRAWIGGAFELVVSPHLLDEIDRVLRYPKIRKRISSDDAAAFVAALRAEADERPDPKGVPSIATADPDDDYLVALAASAQALIVSGDHHLLDLRGQIPVYSPAEFLELLKPST